MNNQEIYNRYYWLSLQFFIAMYSGQDTTKYAYRRKRFNKRITKKYGFAPYAMTNFIGQIRKKARQDAENSVL